MTSLFDKELVNGVYRQIISSGNLFALDVARGLVSGITSVNKFGKAPSGVQVTETDI